MSALLQSKNRLPQPLVWKIYASASAAADEALQDAAWSRLTPRAQTAKVGKRLSQFFYAADLQRYLAEIKSLDRESLSQYEAAAVIAARRLDFDSVCRLFRQVYEAELRVSDDILSLSHSLSLSLVFFSFFFQILPTNSNLFCVP
jgi:hypothetical protein